MTNGDAATHALAEAFGKVVEEAVGRGIKPLEDRLNSLEDRLNSLEDRLNSLESRMNSLESRMNSLELRMNSLESELHEVHECVQIPEAMERRALIGQTAGK